MSPRINNNNTFDDDTNDWLREHADHLKGIEGARHLKANPIEDPLGEDKPAAPADPQCTACGGPIFEEFVDLKHPEVCTRPKCQKRRRKRAKELAKFERERAEGANPGAAKPAPTSKSKPAQATRRRAVRDDYDLEGSEFRDAVDDMNDLAHKFFVEDPLEREKEEEDRRKDFGEDLNSSGAETEIGDEVDEVDDDFDETPEEEGEDPEGTDTRRTRVEPTKRKPPKRVFADGEGIVPIASDLGGDDDLPLLVRVRKGYRPPAQPRPGPARRCSSSEPLKSCEAHGVAKCPTCFPESDAVRAFREQREKLKALWEAQEEERYLEMVRLGEIVPPPKNETEAMEQGAARITKERLEKEEMAKRKIVRKRRPKFEPKETPNLRLRYKFMPRQVADVLDIPLFNEPFSVLNRSLLYDPASIFHSWYGQLKKDMEDRGLVDIRDARRRGDQRYEDYTRWQTEWEVIDGKPTVVTSEDRYVRPEFVMIDGVAHFVDPVEADALAAAGVAVPVTEETEPADLFITKTPMPTKIKRRVGVKTPRQKSPSTYGEMINMLPYRLDVMITPEERAFYKDYAARNLTRKGLEEKYGEKTDDEILLLENRAIKWAVKLRLLEPPLEEFEPDWERLLDEDIEADKRMISKTGGACIGGRVISGKLNRYGKTTKLNSFRTPPIREGSGYGDSGSEGRWSPDYDDFGDESAA
jgi:hypothetical protein